MKATASRPNLIQSVDRALALLEVLADADEELPLGELARRAGLNTSTCHHLISTLMARGYVSQSTRTREYGLGNQILRLQHARLHQIDLVNAAMPLLRELNQSTTEAVHLAVMQSYELVTVAKLESLHALKVDNGFVGKSNAAHATATGKAILAHMPEWELNQIIALRGLTAFTRRTITDPAALRAELERVRLQGFSVDDEEFQPSVFCVGAPIRNHTGKVVASLSCSAPQMRVGSQEAVDRLSSLSIQAAEKISSLLGHQV